MPTESSNIPNIDKLDDAERAALLKKLQSKSGSSEKTDIELFDGEKQPEIPVNGAVVIEASSDLERSSAVETAPVSNPGIKKDGIANQGTKVESSSSDSVESVFSTNVEEGKDLLKAPNGAVDLVDWLNQLDSGKDQK